MKQFVVVALVCIVVCVAARKDPLTVETCGRAPLRDSDRIVGGGHAKHGMYPWMVSLYEQDGSWYHACGATIINERWIVTAAHCIDFKNSPSSYKIYAGLHRQSEKDHWAVKEYRISDIYLHENYDRITHSNDIALLRTSKPIDITGSGGYINGVCLPRDNNDPSGLVTVTGWGHERSYGSNSDTLKHLLTPIVDREACNEAYRRHAIILENMICAGQENEDTCQNDSGGPMIKTSNGVSTLVGITSFGRGCGLKVWPGVYTKIGHFKAWMEGIIQTRDPEYRASP